MHKRHRFFWKIFRPLVVLFLKIRFGYKFEKPKNLPENYIVIANHATDYDMLLAGVAFKNPMYFVGSEHISRWKLLYPFLKFAFSPILRYKGMLGTSGVIEILQRAKKGANICLFAEGVRSWDGCPSPVLPSTAALVKRAKCGLVTYKLIGGYFVSPVWSGKNLRRGYLRGEPVNVYTKEQIAAMSNEEIYEAIVRDIGEDAYARQLVEPKRYRGKNLSLGLDRLLFLCPSCRSNGTLHSTGDAVKCGHCGLAFSYDEYGMLNGSPYKTVKEFVAWQKEQVVLDVTNNVTYTVPDASLSSVENHEEKAVAQGMLSIDREWIRCGNFEARLSDLSGLAIHGKNALVFMANKTYYELLLSTSDSAMKFVYYFNACQEANACATARK